MPNANKKKHLKPKKYKVNNVMDFVKGFVTNLGGKESAFVKAQTLEKAALSASTPDTKTANFWSNIKGHIRKAQ